MPEHLEKALERFPLEAWNVLVDLSPSLLLGLLLAGALHVFLPRGLIRRRLSGSRTRSVIEAVAFGVPMPLCSCGVVPAALGLRRQGASRGAATGFLISTPQTGVDSIAVSASILGWPFALFKVGAALVTGVVGGLIVNATEPSSTAAPDARMPVEDAPRGNRIAGLLRFAILELLASFHLWLVFGIAVSAAISALVPPGYLEDAAWVHGLGGMLLVLALSLPLYVCSTASVPIAASLIAAGMPAGSALVFLMAGPATNAATIGAVWRELGTRVLAIYVGVVTLFSIGFGLAFDFVIGGAAGGAAIRAHEHGTDWIGVSGALLVAGLILFLAGRRVVLRFRRPTASIAAQAANSPCCHGCGASAPDAGREA